MHPIIQMMRHKALTFCRREPHSSTKKPQNISIVLKQSNGWCSWSWFDANNDNNTEPVISRRVINLLIPRRSSSYGHMGGELFWCVKVSARPKSRQLFSNLDTNSSLRNDELALIEFFGDSEEQARLAESNDVISHCMISHWQMKWALNSK